jgi:hypothetical protein
MSNTEENHKNNDILLENIKTFLPNSVDVALALSDILGFLQATKSVAGKQYLPAFHIVDTFFVLTRGVIDMINAHDANRNKIKKITIAVQSTLLETGANLSALGLTIGSIVTKIMTGVAKVALLPLAMLVMSIEYWNSFLISCHNAYYAIKKQDTVYLAQDRLIKVKHILEKISDQKNNKKELSPSALKEKKADVIRLLNQAIVLYKVERDNSHLETDGNKRSSKANLIGEELVSIIKEINKNPIFEKNKHADFHTEIQTLIKSIDDKAILEEKQLFTHLQKKQTEKMNQISFNAVLSGAGAIGLTLLAVAPFVPALLPVTVLGASLLTVVGVSACLVAATLGTYQLMSAGYQYLMNHHAVNKDIHHEIHLLKKETNEKNYDVQHTLRDRFLELYHKKGKTMNRSTQDFNAYLNEIHAGKDENLEAVLGYYKDNAETETIKALKSKFKNANDWRPEYPLIHTLNEKKITAKEIEKMDRKEIMEKFFTYYDVSPEKLKDRELSPAERQGIFDLYINKYADKQNPKDYIEFIKTKDDKSLEKLISPYLKKIAEDTLVLKVLNPTRVSKAEKSSDEKKLLSSLSQKDRQKLIQEHALTAKVLNKKVVNKNSAKDEISDHDPSLHRE